MCDQPQHPLSDAREGRTREAHGFSGMMSRETSPLSLAIMRGRVSLLKRELEIDSTPGNGTTIMVEIPVSQA
jgi:nitrate/nitrite-specific signal transduction histidine kinase